MPASRSSICRRKRHDALWPPSASTAPSRSIVSRWAAIQSAVGRVTLLGGDEHLGLNVLDLVRPRSPRYAAAALDRSVRVPLRDRTIKAVTPSDFVVFKALAARDRDSDDAASVLRRSPGLIDVALIEREIDLLASEVPDHDVRTRWALIRERGAS